MGCTLHSPQALRPSMCVRSEMMEGMRKRESRHGSASLQSEPSLRRAQDPTDVSRAHGAGRAAQQSMFHVSRACILDGRRRVAEGPKGYTAQRQMSILSTQHGVLWLSVPHTCSRALTHRQRRPVTMGRGCGASRAAVLVVIAARPRRGTQGWSRSRTLFRRPPPWANRRWQRAPSRRTSKGLVRPALERK